MLSRINEPDVQLEQLIQFGVLPLSLHFFSIGQLVSKKKKKKKKEKKTLCTLTYFEHLRKKNRLSKHDRIVFTDDEWTGRRKVMGIAASIYT